MSKKCVEVLFPEVANLYGEPFNARYLAMCVEDSGYEAVVIQDELSKEPYFAKERPDFVYMGAMTEHSQELVIDRLRPYVDRLRSLIEDGVVFLFTGNAFEILNREILCEDGRVIPALNIYPLSAKRKMFNRYNSLFLGTGTGCRIVGFKSQFSHSYGELPENLQWITVERGDGCNPEMTGVRKEGILDRNLMATYLLGPLLVLNPDLTLEILHRMGVADPKLRNHEEIYNAYRIRLAEFENPAVELA